MLNQINLTEDLHWNSSLASLSSVQGRCFTLGWRYSWKWCYQNHKKMWCIMNVKLWIPMGSLFCKGVELLNLNISTGAPNLRTFKTIPAEGEDVISWSEALRNFNQILENPRIPGVYLFRKVYFGPFWAFRCCPCLRRDQFHGDPTPLEVLRFGNPRLPIDPRSCPFNIVFNSNYFVDIQAICYAILLCYNIKNELKALCQGTIDPFCAWKPPILMP